MSRPVSREPARPRGAEADAQGVRPGSRATRDAARGPRRRALRAHAPHDRAVALPPASPLGAAGARAATARAAAGLQLRRVPELARRRVAGARLVDPGLRGADDGRPAWPEVEVLVDERCNQRAGDRPRPVDPPA